MMSGDIKDNEDDDKIKDKEEFKVDLNSVHGRVGQFEASCVKLVSFIGSTGPLL